MDSPMSSMPVIQVSFSTLNLEATAAWYREVIGFLPGGAWQEVTGPEAAAFLGFPACNADLMWLLDSTDLFQLEFFQFSDPASVPGSRRPDDAGWSLVGLYVDDLDAVLARLREAGSQVGPVLGDKPERRVCTRDPEGVWLELRERVPGVSLTRTIRDAPVTTAFVRVVVTDLAGAQDFFCDALGLRDTGAVLHTEADEELWGSPATSATSCVLSAEGFHDGPVIELVQYETRVPRPLPEGYRVSDQGILNVAFGSRSPGIYDAVLDRFRASGFQLHAELKVASARGHFAVGAEGLSVEFLTVPDLETEQLLGFGPKGTFPEPH
ncbi:VOC family protein [Streptomyces sp. NPDC001658]